MLVHECDVNAIASSKRCVRILCWPTPVLPPFLLRILEHSPSYHSHPSPRPPCSFGLPHPHPTTSLPLHLHPSISHLLSIPSSHTHPHRWSPLPSLFLRILLLRRLPVLLILLPFNRVCSVSLLLLFPSLCCLSLLSLPQKRLLSALSSCATTRCLLLALSLHPASSAFPPPRSSSPPLIDLSKVATAPRR